MALSQTVMRPTLKTLEILADKVFLYLIHLNQTVE
jgi:hypothetical protein